jgi:hypothetical protein
MIPAIHQFGNRTNRLIRPDERTGHTHTIPTKVGG